MKIVLIRRLFPLLVAFFGLAAFAVSDAELARLAAADYAHPVRPVGIDGQPAWNNRAIWFMYPPAFDFTNLTAAASYRFTVTDATNGVHIFSAARPNAPLLPVWPELCVGWTRVTCEGLAADGQTLGLAGGRDFWRISPYRPGSYPKAQHGYGETAARIVGYVLEMDFVRDHYLGSKPVSDAKLDVTNQMLVSYPSKMGAALINAAADLAECDPARRELALTLANGVRRHLATMTEPAGTALAGFPRTYCDYPGLVAWPAKMIKEHNGKIMMIYPATVGSAYLRLHRVNGDPAALRDAIAIGERYLLLQQADGTWPLNCSRADASAIEANRLVPILAITFLEQLYAATQDVRYRQAADRAFAYLERGPLANWNWEGQFEDSRPRPPYQNLTKHDACSTAIYLLKRFPGDPARLETARELVRFAEDQFAVWELPVGLAEKDPRFPGGRTLYGIGSWRCPAAVEQYNFYNPVDASAAKFIFAYLALYRATGNPLDLAKARTMGDAIVRETDGSGHLPTIWNNWEEEDWVNCMLMSASALTELAGVSD